MIIISLAFLILATVPTKAIETLQLNTRNTVNLRGPISEQSLASIQKELILKAMNRRHSKVYLVINSPGGSVFAGDAFLNSIRHLTNISIVCLDCASMAVMMLQAHTGQRIIVENTVLMYHRASSSFSGQIGEGELESRLKMVKEKLAMFEKTISRRLKMSVQAYKAKIKDEWWVHAPEAIATGHADKMVRLSCTKSLIKKTETVHIPTLFGVAKLHFSGCPLLTFPLPSNK